MDRVTARRRAIREMLLEQGGAPDVRALMETLGVSERTIQRDLKAIRDEWETSAAFFEAQRDWALRRSRDPDNEMSESARATWVRLAMDAESKRSAALDLKADEEGGQEVVVRVEPPPGLPDVRPPVPAKHLAGAKHRTGE